MELRWWRPGCLGGDDRYDDADDNHDDSDDHYDDANDHDTDDDHHVVGAFDDSVLALLLRDGEQFAGLDKGVDLLERFG
jgi:hypothetical protein